MNTNEKKRTLRFYLDRPMHEKAYQAYSEACHTGNGNEFIIQAIVAYTEQDKVMDICEAVNRLLHTSETNQSEVVDEIMFEPDYSLCSL